MGHSRQDKAASHDRIVRIAAGRFREAGVGGLSVAELMQEAGLTHGGFYRHFGSRDELVAEALEEALAQSRASVAAAREAGAGYAAIVSDYVSAKHRDTPGLGCAVAALASEAGRLQDRPREAFARHVESSAETFLALLRQTNPAATRADALLAISAMAGAVALARGVSDPALSDEILQGVRERLVALARPDREAAGGDAAA
ncbi:MAG: TetR/AcrR family transcriptional regulator [Inquilinus limosus]|uniref:TetR/AcrR family transcriptional regulator n=1 Tax=Inquilinus limosus TaxID=171674 RepID=A0A952FTK7_9PROT|nr:TetR/AcrR family transcriptional regulator [Inquilinus limosus]